MLAVHHAAAGPAAAKETADGALRVKHQRRRHHRRWGDAAEGAGERQKQAAIVAAAPSSRREPAAREAARMAATAAADGHPLEDVKKKPSTSSRLGPRYVLRLRHDTLRGAGRLLAYGILLSALLKLLLATARRHRWGWAEGEALFAPGIVRDRSLGGRMVPVPRGRWQPWDSLPWRASKRTTKSTTRTQGVGPLDSVESSRSEKDLRRTGGGVASKVSRPTPSRKMAALPAWWPPLDASSPLPTSVSEDRRRSAQTLLQTMLDRRVAGQDFEDEDIVKLQELCRDSRVQVTFEAENAKEALFRAATQVAFKYVPQHSLEGAPSQSTAVATPTKAAVDSAATGMCGHRGSLLAGLDRAGCPAFLASLSKGISIEAHKAATMVNAAVAARTRSSLMQAWALFKQNRLEEAVDELQVLAFIHKTFPLDTRSAEIEMVARGLESRVTAAERRELLWMYANAGGQATKELAASALGVPISSLR
eukprot:SM000068S20568  [mRNA]  locus=s68:195539:199046:+ [translate_table: standard]